jgi:apolipoprotein N-acyltransferase
VKSEAKEVDFIVNQTNEGWFNNSRLVKNIMWQAAVIRAVENRVPIIKTGNYSYNGIIYPTGEYKKVSSDKNYHLLKLN